jgi:hypothetical protein
MVSEAKAAFLWVTKPVAVMSPVDAARSSLTIRSIAFVSQDETINQDKDSSRQETLEGSRRVSGRSEMPGLGGPQFRHWDGTHGPAHATHGAEGFLSRLLDKYSQEYLDESM